MSSYVLRYWPVKSRGEGIRIFLRTIEADFKEVEPKWPDEKDDQPLGQWPVLVETLEDGSEFVLSDSVAIEKYLAAKVGLLVQSGLRDTARENQLRSQIDDLLDLMVAYEYGHAAARESLAEMYKGMAAAFVRYHEKILVANGSNGHYFGDKTTYMDISLFNWLNVVRDPNDKTIPGAAELFSETNAPQLNKVFQTIRGDAVLAKYLAAAN